MLFVIFIHDSVPSNSNELYILLLTATADTSIVRFIGFNPTNIHLDGNDYGDKLLFLNCLHIAVILTSDTLT